MRPRSLLAFTVPCKLAKLREKQEGKMNTSSPVASPCNQRNINNVFSDCSLKIVKTLR